MGSGNLRVEKQRPDDVANAVSDPNAGRIRSFFGISGDIGGAQRDSLQPAGREEGDKIKAHDAARSFT